jgi:hypothetical protein
LIPVSVTPSVGFFLVSLRLSVRFRSTDQAWGEQRSGVKGQHKTLGLQGGGIVLGRGASEGGIVLGPLALSGKAAGLCLPRTIL